MTTLAAILGMLPLALGIGTGSEMYVPLATTVIGGLATSTMLTLFIVPTVYTIFDDLIVRFRKKGSSSDDSPFEQAWWARALDIPPPRRLYTEGEGIVA